MKNNVDEVQNILNYIVNKRNSNNTFLHINNCEPSDYMLGTNDTLDELRGYCEKLILKRYQDLTDEEKLDNLGWTIVCQSPTTIEHIDGSNAVGLAADILISELLENYKDYI